MSKVIKVTTEGDVEGRSNKTLGLFYGSPEQAIGYLMANGVKPYYRYRIEEVETLDVSDLSVGTLKVEVDKYGYLNVKGSLPRETVEEAQVNKLLGGMTEEEKNILYRHFIKMEEGF